ncbi:hypothetical protein [Paracoccus niistensis]|uniref:DUF2946 domain-containing protein n=1 Tax=Paracoccus niistensis TaxID=632935 RepID=A0ABV6I0B3_9RHOB
MIKINVCRPPLVLHGNAMSMRASLGQRSNCSRPARAWGWVVLLCLLVVIGGVSDLQHDTSTHAQSMQVVEVAQSVDDRSDTDAGQLASCHANGACVYLAEPAPALPAPFKQSGERQIEPTLPETSQSIGGIFRPPRLPANA